MSNNNDFIDLTNLDEIRTGTHIIIDYISCTFPFIRHSEDNPDYTLEDLLDYVIDFLGYTVEDLFLEPYAQNRFKYQYTIASCITLRLIGPELKSGYESCNIELKGEGCREWECHAKDKTWRDFLEFFIVKLNGRPTRIDLTIDDFDGKYVDLDFIRYKMDNDYYTTSFRSKKYVIHGNDEYGYTVALGSHESTQELCIYEKNKEQKKKKGYCVQPYWLRYEMRFRREKAFDVCMNLINTEVEKYSEFFYSLLYDMLDLKEDNDYDDNNQYKIETDPKWKSFLNDVTKCKLNKYHIKKKITFETYMEWAKPVICKYLICQCFKNDNNIDKVFIDILSEVVDNKVKDNEFKRMNELFKESGLPIRNHNDLYELKCKMRKHIKEQKQQAQK